MTTRSGHLCEPSRAEARILLVPLDKTEQLYASGSGNVKPHRKQNPELKRHSRAWLPGG